MQLEATIKGKILDAVSKKELFTSVDISNRIKKEGGWVRVSEVRGWLQDNFQDKTLFGDYIVSKILVCDGKSEASLYHPFSKTSDEYTDRDQISLTPDEVKDIQKKIVGTPKIDATPDITQVLSDNDQDVESYAIIKTEERIKIPGHMVKKMGLKPGDSVDPALIKAHSVLPARLIVNKDYRVSIPRSSVLWGTSPVKVMLKKGVITFDKA